MQRGDRLGGFELLDEIGRGGMGAVFEARDVALGRIVALKILLPGPSADPQCVERFKREAQIIAALEHPHIVRVLSYGEVEDRPFFVMERVDGEDLGGILRERGALSVDEALSIAEQVAMALREASAKGVTHRDVKPSNILVDRSGRALITDFGIARLAESPGDLTRSGVLMMTPTFASPEQARGESPDVRSDIYSLGAVLYAALSGTAPFSGETPLAVMTKIATKEVTPLTTVAPALPAPVRALVHEMMAREPEQRPQTPERVIERIRECRGRLAGGRPDLPTGTVPVHSPAAPSVPRSRWPIRTGAALGALAAVLVIVWTVEGGPVQDSHRHAALVVERELLQPAVSAPPEPLEPVVSASPDVREPPPLEAAAPAPEKAPDPLPLRPDVLVVVSGESSLAPLVRARVESALRGKDLNVISSAEVPLLRERLELGATAISWFDVARVLPTGGAHVVVLASIVRTGTTQLRFYGRVEEMTLASFTLQSVDVASGRSIHSGSSGDIQFTALNMSQNVTSGVDPVVDATGAAIRRHWRTRLAAAGGPDRG